MSQRTQEACAWGKGGEGFNDISSLNDVITPDDASNCYFILNSNLKSYKSHFGGPMKADYLNYPGTRLWMSGMDAIWSQPVVWEHRDKYERGLGNIRIGQCSHTLHSC